MSEFHDMIKQSIAQACSAASLPVEAIYDPADNPIQQLIDETAKDGLTMSRSADGQSVHLDLTDEQMSELIRCGEIRIGKTVIQVQATE